MALHSRTSTHHQKHRGTETAAPQAKTKTLLARRRVCHLLPRWFWDCGLTDEDVDDLASCFDGVGRENIKILLLWGDEFTTLPEDIFDDLAAVEIL